MEKPKRYLIVTQGPTGLELHPMKDWMRRHPDQVPKGCDPDAHTSRQLKSALKRNGWKINETAQEVRFLKPDLAMQSSTVAVLGESDSDETGMEAEEEFTFALESHLRDFIARNLQTLPIADKRLRLYQDADRRGGIEYSTGVGPIDILAVDEIGNFFVFELKLAHGPDRAMGQLLRYMGWVTRNLANGRKVYGVVVAKDIDEKLRYAALIVANVYLLEYEVDFKLKAADLEAGMAAEHAKLGQ